MEIDSERQKRDYTATKSREQKDQITEVQEFKEGRHKY